MNDKFGNGHGHIKNIIFDFGGVLVDWNPRYVFSPYFNDESKCESFLNEICTPAWNLEHDRGRTFDEGVRLLTAQHPEYAAEIAMYRDRWKEMFNGELKEGVELLRHVKEEGYRVFGLTNWSAETIDWAFDTFPSFREFEGVVVSGREKIVKPDLRIFRLLLERYSLKAEECVFIDDNAANAAAASETGIHGIHYTGPESLLGFLAKQE